MIICTVILSSIVASTCIATAMTLNPNDKMDLNLHGWSPIQFFTLSYTIKWTKWIEVDEIALASFDVSDGDKGSDRATATYIPEREGPGGVIPEPATMLLFGFDLLGLAGVNRKKY